MCPLVPGEPVQRRRPLPGLEAQVGLSLSPVLTLAGRACLAQLVGCGPVLW